MKTSKTAPPEVLAPGKVFLAGEYSVLAGGWAMVATLAVHARAYLAPGTAPTGPQRGLVRSILRQLEVSESRICPGSRRIELDLSGFYDGSVKRGIGSSSAGTAAVMGLVRVLEQGSVGRRDVLARKCAAVHRNLQDGHGSGADAAACCRGGVIRFRMPATLARTATPDGMHMVAAALGGGGRTTPLLERHQRLVSQGDASAYGNLEVFAEASDRIIDGVGRADWSAIRTGVNLACAAYEELSDIMDTVLVTAADRKAMRASRKLGGFSRPTGAGGGDLHLAYFRDPEAAARFTSWAREQGYHCMDVEPDERGVRLSEGLRERP